MKTYFLQAIKITFLTIVLFGVIYPLFIVGLAKLIGPNRGEGALIKVDERVVGFELIGQSFTEDKYFTSRPSAVGYNAAATGGSNKGPTNPDYLKQVEERISDFLSKNPEITRAQVPVDLVTASGGGLDPHISSQAAIVQVARIAKIRNIDRAAIDALVKSHTEKPMLGMGTARVHVLRLNVALDALK